MCGCDINMDVQIFINSYALGIKQINTNLHILSIYNVGTVIFFVACEIR